MPKNLKRNKQQRAKEAKSCMKVQSKKMTRLEDDILNIFKSLTNTVNRNCPKLLSQTNEKILKNLIVKC